MSRNEADASTIGPVREETAHLEAPREKSWLRAARFSKSGDQPLGERILRQVDWEVDEEFGSGFSMHDPASKVTSSFLDDLGDPRDHIHDDKGAFAEIKTSTPNLNH
jgi:hypothetical protein